MTFLLLRQSSDLTLAILKFARVRPHWCGETGGVNIFEPVGNRWGQAPARDEIIVFCLRILGGFFKFPKSENSLRNILGK